MTTDVGPARPLAGPPTRESLEAELRALGVRAGDTLLVHASMRSTGWVCGGPTAVVLALRDVLGAGGTLVVPTFTAGTRDPVRWEDPRIPAAWHPAIRAHLPAFDPAVTPGQRMGAVSEQVRTWPGAVRSTHPQVSFAAVGRHAGTVVAGHDLDCHLGERSPLRRLEDLDARVLLIGVGWEWCTAFHLAEYRRPDPPLREYSCAVRLDGRRTWTAFVDVDLDDGDFAAMGAALEQDPERGGDVARGSLAAAPARLVPLRTAVAHAGGWLRDHRPHLP